MGHRRQGGLREKISAATAGKLKTCAICGKTGHNKKTCPDVPANAARASSARQPRRCSLCGKLGHRRDSCPEAEVPPPCGCLAANGDPALLSLSNAPVHLMRHRGSSSIRALFAFRRIASPLGPHQHNVVFGVVSMSWTEAKHCSSHKAKQFSQGCGHPADKRVSIRLSYGAQALSVNELGSLPTRTCSQCGGKGHDRRTCPELDADAAVRRRQRQSYVARKVTVNLQILIARPSARDPGCVTLRMAGGEALIAGTTFDLQRDSESMHCGC